MLQMFDDIKEHCPDWKDKAAITEYLAKILDKKAFDGSGLIYGMGHAVYSLSDPRERIFRGYVVKHLTIHHFSEVCSHLILIIPVLHMRTDVPHHLHHLDIGTAVLWSLKG